MDMITHQYVSMKFNVGVEQGFVQVLQVALAVVVIEETGQAVVAALNDMLGYVGKVKSRQAGHSGSFVAKPDQLLRRTPVLGSETSDQGLLEVNLTPLVGVR